MISPIPGNDPHGHNQVDPAGDQHEVTTHAHKPAAQPQPTETQRDNVELSHFARARSLKNQGYSIQEIATIMNTDVKSVMDYIG